MPLYRISTLGLIAAWFVGSIFAGPIVQAHPRPDPLTEWVSPSFCNGAAPPTCALYTDAVGESESNRRKQFLSFATGGQYGSGIFDGWGYNGSGDPEGSGGGSYFLPTAGDPGPDPADAPEPASVWLLTAGIGAIALLRLNSTRRSAARSAPCVPLSSEPPRRQPGA